MLTHCSNHLPFLVQTPPVLHIVLPYLLQQWYPTTDISPHMAVYILLTHWLTRQLCWHSGNLRHLVWSSLLFALLQPSVRDNQNLNMICSKLRPKKEHVKENSITQYKYKNFIPHLSMNQHDPFCFLKLQTKHCTKSGMIFATLKYVTVPHGN
jgi:hypothetical protein